MSDQNPAAPAAPESDVQVAATGAPEWYHEGRLVPKDDVVIVTPDVAKRVVASGAAKQV